MRIPSFQEVRGPRNVIDSSIPGSFVTSVASNIRHISEIRYHLSLWMKQALHREDQTLPRLDIISFDIVVVPWGSIHADIDLGQPSYKQMRRVTAGRLLMIRDETGEIVARCSVLAGLLEVSAYPKPGNVHRLRDKIETKYEHFLAGNVAMGSAMRALALHGYDVQKGNQAWTNLKIGYRIQTAVEAMMNWQRGGNVNLGVILLFAPMAATAGHVLHKDGFVDVDEFKEALNTVTRSTTSDDVVAVYKAIRMALPVNVLGQVEELDILEDSSMKRIKKERLTLQDIFKRCAHRDSICSEWISNFEITLTLGHPYLKKALMDSNDINSAIVDTFLRLLSRQPDSLITRKSGIEKAVEVSEKACHILEEGGMGSEIGRKLLWSLDEELHSGGGKLNPGTTADLTAASIFLTLLEGWRP
jgi:triphosphoribosyl-dephospho-CoA synthase